jgi:hypothetical protein
VDKLVARSVSQSRVSHKGKSPSPPKFFDVQRPAEPKCNLNLSRCTSHDYFKWHSVRMAQLQSYLYFHCYHVTGSTVHDFVAAICLRTLRSWNKFMGSVRSAEGNNQAYSANWVKHVFVARSQKSQDVEKARLERSKLRYFLMHARNQRKH